MLLTLGRFELSLLLALLSPLPSPHPSRRLLFSVLLHHFECFPLAPVVQPLGVAVPAVVYDAGEDFDDADSTAAVGTCIVPCVKCFVGFLRRPRTTFVSRAVVAACADVGSCPKNNRCGRSCFC